MEVQIKEIHRAEELDSFISFPDQLYKDCRYYVPALHNGQFSTLSKEKNPAFEHCEARYWLAYAGTKVVGRVAAIINHRYNQERNTRLMRFGWLDFIEDKAVLHSLMQEVEQWAIKKGMETVHGPLGFTSFDASGVLVEGFEEWPTSFGRYNFPYYDKMLKEAGYAKEIDWVEYNIKVPHEKPKRLIAAAALIKKRYAVKNARLRSRSDLLGYGNQIFKLINTVYSDLFGFSTLNPEQIENLTKEFLSLIHPDYVSIIVNERDEVVAFGVVIPSLTQALKKARGKLYPMGYLHILKALHFNDTVDMILIGVKPDYQNKGLHALIFEKITETLFRKGIRQVETTRELEDNHKVQQLWAGYETRQHKRARCYSKPIV